jgi:hypothetical protein
MRDVTRVAAGTTVEVVAATYCIVVGTATELSRGEGAAGLRIGTGVGRAGGVGFDVGERKARDGFFTNCLGALMMNEITFVALGAAVHVVAATLSVAVRAASI